MKAESKRQTRDRMTQAAANGAVVRRATPTALSSEFADISGGRRRRWSEWLGWVELKV